jgi:hypothetical protein
LVFEDSDRLFKINLADVVEARRIKIAIHRRDLFA